MVPVTVIEAGPCVVTQVKTVEKDGYEGVQVAFRRRQGEAGEQAAQGPFREGGRRRRSGTCARCRSTASSDVDARAGDQGRHLRRRATLVKVTGISKGKGFAGAVKRWHFHGGDMTHGSMIHRKPQSGGATDAARTFKGVKRPGRMGGETVTQRGLTVYRVDADAEPAADQGRGAGRERRPGADRQADGGRIVECLRSVCAICRASQVGELELNGEVFEVAPNVPLMHQAVVAEQANAAPGDRRHKDARRGPRRRKEAVSPEGHRPRATGHRSALRTATTAAWCSGRIRDLTRRRCPRRCGEARVRSALSARLADEAIVVRRRDQAGQDQHQGDGRASWTASRRSARRWWCWTR